MDRHVRWFRREIAVGVARRLAAETVFAGLLALGAALLLGATAITAIFTAAMVIPFGALLRVALACATNPMNSSYLIRWPHPTGEILPKAQTNADSADDMALRSFEFGCRGAFEEWGGALTNVYTRESNQIVVTTSDDGDLVVISGLDGGQLVVTTKQLIPPHERLIVNHRSNTDVRSGLVSHIELMKDLTAQGRKVTTVGFHEVLEVLAIEWDAWDQIGPLLGPFVMVGSRFSPAVLQVSVAASDVLARTSDAPPRITAGTQPTFLPFPATTSVLPAVTVTLPQTVPTPPPIPTLTVVPPPVHGFPTQNIEAA